MTIYAHLIVFAPLVASVVFLAAVVVGYWRERIRAHRGWTGFDDEALREYADRQGR